MKTLITPYGLAQRECPTLQIATSGKITKNGFYYRKAYLTDNNHVTLT